MKEIDLLTFKRITIMKKVYNIPSTTTVAFQAGLICAGSPTRTVSGNALTGGGKTPGGVDPM